jgi:hypothetical protein
MDFVEASSFSGNEFEKRLAVYALAIFSKVFRSPYSVDIIYL